MPKINKKHILIIAILIVAFILIISLQKPTITGNTIKDNLLEIANNNKEVQNFIKNKEYTIEIKSLEDNLYKVTYKADNKEFLIVLLNKGKVLNVTSLKYTPLSIELENKSYKRDMWIG